MLPHLKINARIVNSLRKAKRPAGIASWGSRHCLRRARFALGHPLPSASHDIEWCPERENRFAMPDSPSHPRPPCNPTPPLTPPCCSGVARMVSPPLGWHGKLKNRGNHSPTPSLASCVCPVLKVGWRDGNRRGRGERRSSTTRSPRRRSGHSLLPLHCRLLPRGHWDAF